ncbi:MAG TPA: type II CAAX endopeptidase family protein [Anaerolineales bacterium]|nr:type II CAAX endopeptidase family protein [Anaerolineales bacterium]
MSTSTSIQQATVPSMLRRLAARHPVATFLVMTFTVSMTIAFVRLRTNGDIGQSPSYQYLVGFLEHLLSVALPAFIVVAAMHGKAGVRALARRSLRWQVDARWYLIALLGLPIASVLCTSVIYGVAPLNALVDNWQLLFTLILPSLLIRIVFLNTLEEIGWLGFLQARLQDQYGPWKACLLVEIPFALWHLPGLLGDTDGQLSLALTLGGIFALFQLCGRFVIMWLYNNTKCSVLLAGIFHATYNTTINTYAGDFIPVPAAPWFFIVSGVVAVAAVLIVIFTKGQLSYEPDHVSQAEDAQSAKG